MRYVKRGGDGIWRVAQGSGFDDLGPLHPPSVEALGKMQILEKQQVVAPVEGTPVVVRAVALVVDGEGWADV